MKRAIVTGATGLVGKAVVLQLVNAGIKVLCIGRRQIDPSKANNFFKCKITYLSLSISNIENLPIELDKLDWDVGKDCVFYHFAWAGQNKLTDGSLEDQMKNSIYAAKSIKIAKKIGCIKFITSGSLEETFARSNIDQSFKTYMPSQINYTIAKLACHDMCAIVAYLEKIDYVHTRLSVPLKPDLSEGNYIANTLKKISKKEFYDKPKNKQLFDIILIEDVAKAYILIGEYGKNKADYFIGTGNPTMLGDYFKDFEQLVVSSKTANDEIDYPGLEKNFFDISDLSKDTGFKPLASRFDVKKVI